MTVLWEGQTVSAQEDRSARGHIVMIAGADSAHVKWATGPYAGTMTLEDVYDLDPVVAGQIDEPDPMHLVAVRRAFDASQETGVLNFLASNKYLDSWQKIARDVVEFVEDKIRVDASMELVEEQLTTPERDMVVQAAALALLRDAFAAVEE
jgi:hypothetical protein